jgi:two-component system OmpR family sensor kinase
VGHRVQGGLTEIAEDRDGRRRGWTLRQTLRGRLLLGALVGLLAAATVFAIVSSELIRSQTAQASRATFDGQAQRVAALVATETIEQTASGVCRSYTSADLRAFVGPAARLYIDAPPLCPGTAQVAANHLPSDQVRINPAALARDGYEHVDFRAPGASSATVATAVPIVVGGQTVGAIVLAKPVSAVATSWSEVVPNLLLAALVGLIPAFILTLWITGRLTRPLREMESAADRVAAGDLTVSVPPAGTEELDHVATAFNAMVGRLRERDDRSRAFLMNVTHDLRTPLTAIRGHAAALRDGIVPAKDVDRSLGAIEGEAARLSAMVTDLLDLARIDAHQFRVQPATVNPAATLDDAYAAQVAVAEARGVSLTTDIGALPTIVTDAKRFRQIIDNLLSNAIRWTPTGGSVTVDAYPSPDGGITVRISDSGPGVPHDQREAVFAPFHAEPDPDGRTGAGLGLAICRQLARALDGDVVVDDGPLGGAMFLVTLPAASSTGAAGAN